MQSVWISAAVRSALLTAALLAVPGVAMRFTPALNWGIEDFAAAALLMFIAAWAGQIAWRRGKTRGRSVIMVAAVLLVAAVVWAELAVGIFS